MTLRTIAQTVLVASALTQATAIVHAQQVVARNPANAAGAQGFNVVLVLGDLETGPGAPDNLPVAARKALADMKDFLPYKSYKLLDTAWILSANDATRATSRLRGPDERTYDLTLSATVEPSAPASRSLRVSFQLRDTVLREITTVQEGSTTPTLDYLHAQMEKHAQRRADPPKTPQQARERAAEDAQQARERMEERNREVEKLVERRRLEAQAGNAGGELLIVRPGVLQTRISATSTPLIDTGFTMDIGETVIVGTSRVRGDKALITLLTAVARGKK